jgi:uncharacterized protein YjbI with pentapeptide repeats
MANPQHIKWLLEGVEAWNQRRNSEIFTPDFEGADLYDEFRKAGKLDRNGRIPLSGVDFGDPYAHYANASWFYDAKAGPSNDTSDYRRFVICGRESFDDDDGLSSNANLIGVNLIFADLTGANLNGAYLKHADLFGADFTNADLSRANLSDAKLGESRFINSNLTRANLTNSLPIEADFTGANLNSANVTNADLVNVNLKGANLAGVQLWKAVLFSEKSVPQKRYPR